MNSDDRGDARILPLADAVAFVRTWQHDPSNLHACPFCPKGHLHIVDRSARPYREWYALSCATCDFAQTVSVPLAAQVPGAD